VQCSVQPPITRSRCDPVWATRGRRLALDRRHRSAESTIDEVTDSRVGWVLTVSRIESLRRSVRQSDTICSRTHRTRTVDDNDRRDETRRLSLAHLCSDEARDANEVATRAPSASGVGIVIGNCTRALSSLAPRLTLPPFVVGPTRLLRWC
jgi:hypothetical protein